jgi:glutamate-1-semialdehyde 2,1-aminomutase
MLVKNRVFTQKIFADLCERLPGGVNSPVRACSDMGQVPMVVDYAFEDLIVDIDGQTYIDYCGSWGALIHGHAHPEILNAVAQRMAKGTTFGVTTAVEGELAAEIIGTVEAIEKIRFVSSGTEATMSAVRLARGFTGRDFIVKFNGNYHGHADLFLVQAGSGVFNLSPASSSAGIPADSVKHTLSLPYNDIEACRKIFDHPEYRDQIACVILEPVAANMGVVPATPEFIQFLRTETKKRGALLIFDEVITGFRIGLKGASDYFLVKPDLVCLGKIIGGGFPAAAFGGRRDIMDCLAPVGPVYQAGTLSGNPVAMEAGLQALRLAKKDGFYESLNKKTDTLVKPIQEAIRQMGLQACIQRVGSMFTIFFGREKLENMDDVKLISSETFARFFRYMFERGVYIPPSPNEAWFISQAHTEEHLIRTRGLILDFLQNERTDL